MDTILLIFLGYYVLLFEKKNVGFIYIQIKINNFKNHYFCILNEDKVNDLSSKKVNCEKCVLNLRKKLTRA